VHQRLLGLRRLQLQIAIGECSFDFAGGIGIFCECFGQHRQRLRKSSSAVQAAAEREQALRFAAIRKIDVPRLFEIAGRNQVQQSALAGLARLFGFLSDNAAQHKQAGGLEWFG
jgi:hypothetical protein